MAKVDTSLLASLNNRENDLRYSENQFFTSGNDYLNTTFALL